MVGDRPLEDDVGLSEAGLEVAAAHRGLEADVGAHLGMDERSVRFERREGEGGDGQLLVGHVDGLRRVFRRVAVIGQHQRDGRAHTCDALTHQGPGIRHPDFDARRVPGHRGLAELALDVRRREHGVHAGLGERRGRVDCEQAGVGVRRAHEDGVQLARELDVVDETPGAAQEPRILAAREIRADEGPSGQGPFLGFAVPPGLPPGSSAATVPASPAAISSASSAARDRRRSRRRKNSAEAAAMKTAPITIL